MQNDTSYVHTNENNLYDLLAINSEASREEIRFAAISQRTKGIDSRAISIAQDILTNPHHRDLYELALEEGILDNIDPAEIFRVLDSRFGTMKKVKANVPKNFFSANELGRTTIIPTIAGNTAFNIITGLAGTTELKTSSLMAATTLSSALAARFSGEIIGKNSSPSTKAIIHTLTSAAVALTVAIAGDTFGSRFGFQPNIPTILTAIGVPLMSGHRSNQAALGR